jgi:hypothetical protein
MEEQKTLLNEVALEEYDAGDKPFDFLEEGGETALVCEPDPAIRGKIIDNLKELGYQQCGFISSILWWLTNSSIRQTRIRMTFCNIWKI